MKYKVEIMETLSRVIEVEAVDETEAVDKVCQAYYDEEIVLDSADNIDVEASIIY